MDKKKIAMLQEQGWNIGNASDFLSLSNEEALYVELKVSLAQFLQEKRKAKNFTQEQLAALMNSSQSRIAKMEKSDSTVSLDLMVRSLLALGASKTELANAISIKSRRHMTLKQDSSQAKPRTRTSLLSGKVHSRYRRLPVRIPKSY
jgi:transcriptional regulator with XRE-family HTH domain